MARQSWKGGTKRPAERQALRRFRHQSPGDERVQARLSTTSPLLLLSVLLMLPP